MLLLRDHWQINGSSFFYVLSGRKTIEKRIKMLLSFQGIKTIVEARYACFLGRGGVVVGALG